jgi:hypothetical protein
MGCLALAWAASGCVLFAPPVETRDASGPSTTQDAAAGDGGADAGDAGPPHDSGTRDAAVSVPRDASAPPDASPSDATQPWRDAGVADAARPDDAAVPNPDASNPTPDSGPPAPDASVADAAVLDSGVPDAALADASVADAARPDATPPAADAGPVPDAAGPPDGNLVNPYYPQPTWRLWTQDETPVHYTGYNLSDPVLKEGDFSPPPVATRKYLDPDVDTHPKPFLSLVSFPTTPPMAGFWDDAYATRDGAHSVLGLGWSDVYGNSVNLGNQYIRVGFGSCQPPDILRLGVNFTSESYANSGHQLVSSAFSLLYTERNFSFVNTVRGTPAYLSYAETIADRGIDSYDGLYGHAFNSLGRSSSEVGGLYKMLLAGGAMPRTTKDLLKRHGMYGLALINLFRSTLPYTEADGTPVGPGNEMLQRPAYFSNGNNRSQEFAPRNVVYHQYDESLHVYRMLEGARAMTVAPPIAMVRVVDITVQSGGATLVNRAPTDARIRSAVKTGVRVWGNAGETITLRVDVGGSVDLQGRALTPEWHRVYPGQHNLTMEHEAGTVWRITAAHDPALPKGRIAAVLFVDNGVLRSSPAFVNFYWPEAGQTEGPPYVVAANPISTHEVQKNLRPTFTTSLRSDWVHVTPGSTASFDVACADPNGFPIRYYRWANEVGTLSGTHFAHSVSGSDPGFVYPVHLVCSDGTGGYNSLMVRVVVTPADGVLPAPWSTTVFGLPEMAGSATYASGVFDVVGNGPEIAGSDHGRMVFQELTGDVEMTANVVDLVVEGANNNINAKGGVYIRESLDVGSRGAFVYARGNARSATPLSLGSHVRINVDSTPGNKLGNAVLATQPHHVKAIRRGTALVGLGSTDGLVWEQVWSGVAPSPSASVYAGLAVLSADATRGDAALMAHGRFEVLAAPVVSIPVATLAGTLVTPNTTHYGAQVTVTLLAALPSHEVRYTTDGSDPSATSTLYAAPFDITAAGETVLKARAFEGTDVSHLMVLPLTVTP